MTVIRTRSVFLWSKDLNLELDLLMTVIYELCFLLLKIRYNSICNSGTLKGFNIIGVDYGEE